MKQSLSGNLASTVGVILWCLVLSGCQAISADHNNRSPASKNRSTQSVELYQALAGQLGVNVANLDLEQIRSGVGQQGRHTPGVAVLSRFLSSLSKISPTEFVPAIAHGVPGVVPWEVNGSVEKLFAGGPPFDSLREKTEAIARVVVSSDLGRLSSLTEHGEADTELESIVTASIYVLSLGYIFEYLHNLALPEEAVRFSSLGTYTPGNGGGRHQDLNASLAVSISIPTAEAADRDTESKVGTLVFLPRTQSFGLPVVEKGDACPALNDEVCLETAAYDAVILRGADAADREHPAPYHQSSLHKEQRYNIAMLFKKRLASPCRTP